MIEKFKKDGCAVPTQESAARKDWEGEVIEHVYWLLGPIAVPIRKSYCSPRPFPSKFYVTS
jgi:hypothetical protein